MKKKEVLRSYNFSDADLVSTCYEKINFMRRDKSEFDGYGIQPSDVDAFEKQTNLFADTATDIEFLSNQTEENQAKDAIAEEVREAIRAVMGRVILKYPENSARYRKFGASATAKQNDAELLVTARRVVRVGTLLLPELAENGLTQELLNKVNDLRDQLKAKMDEVDDAVSDRDIEQEARVEAGNALYAALVKYAATGQNIWKSTNVAKYNDYIIYNTPSSGAEPTTPPTV